MRALFIAAFAFAAAVASATGLNAEGNAVGDVIVPNTVLKGAKSMEELSYDDFDTLFKDVQDHPEWFGLTTTAEVEVESINGIVSDNLGAKAGAFAYAYSQSSGRFSGPAFNGGYINTVGCSGQKGSCRNNPSCQCQRSVGPLPQGGYKLSSMMTFKGMPYCYVLTMTSGSACGRSGFLIHGGNCAGNPSEGCIVIQDQNTRYLIKGGGTLTVTA